MPYVALDAYPNGQPRASNIALSLSGDNTRQEGSRKRSVGLYLDDTTMQLVDTAKHTLSMNRSEFIRWCIMHTLDESSILRTRIKEGLVAAEAK